MEVSSQKCNHLYVRHSPTQDHTLTVFKKPGGPLILKIYNKVNSLIPKDLTVNNVNPYWRKSTKSQVKSVIVIKGTSSPVCLSSVNVDGIPCCRRMFCVQRSMLSIQGKRRRRFCTRKKWQTGVWGRDAMGRHHQNIKSKINRRRRGGGYTFCGCIQSGGDPRLTHWLTAFALWRLGSLSLWGEQRRRRLGWRSCFCGQTGRAKNKSDPRQTRLCGRMWCSWWCCSWLLVLCFSDAAVAQGDDHGARNIREKSWIEKRLLGW